MQLNRCIGICAAILAAAGLWGAFGCGTRDAGVASVVPTASLVRSTELVPFRDPWRHARPRFWDIADRPLSHYIGTGFDYHKPRVLLRYETHPAAPYFVGALEAKGLKPNFAYQMKLAGKPTRGSRGWGRGGDDTASARLGAAGRWWCDSVHEGQAFFDDKHYQRYYQKAKPGREHNIYGYLFLGTFVTDQAGNAMVPIKGDTSYHITWRDEQNGHKDMEAGTYIVRSESGNGYGTPVPTATVKLWYEYQAGRPREVRLPKGTYNCRLLLTEETFHNLLGGTKDIHGGYWQTVLATEDHTSGKPDTDAGNDIVFTIR